MRSDGMQSFTIYRIRPTVSTIVFSARGSHPSEALERFAAHSPSLIREGETYFVAPTDTNADIYDDTLFKWRKVKQPSHEAAPVHLVTLGTVGKLSDLGYRS